ncbi:acyloxyacyl hydrolase [Maricaulaceae bacterium MS644]
MKALLVAGAFAALAAAPVHAQLVEEVRVALVAHDVVDHAEDGPQIGLEALFKSPDFLAPIGAPRPYVYASISTQGYTNLVATGLNWTGRFSDRWSIEGAFGISYNDGVDDIVDLPPDDPVRIETARTRALLGSDWLFHSRLGLDYALTETWAVGAYYEHFSHGQILASGRNQALDEFGVRLGYRFGG